ncbi:transmembrane protein 14A [Latimeria chalumnae]|uniref:Transmembrane protein 14A n=1 Tax=Latimeria chalumnae TaxID=7897 RepID=H3AXC5_LATCH|nr:PREDICTED: transmembrane protein 14A [Latimeria chalumnae]|eukprot:XP_006004808.1 PREDICTED: transmembrane protein 14A [Latimeria chalumnae]
MPVDWIGFGYAAAITLGGVLGYKKKGSVMSLIAGLVFGSLSGYGAYAVSNDPKDVKLSLFAAFTLTTIMGVRYRRSKKFMPAGLIAFLSLLMVLRLGFMLL